MNKKTVLLSISSLMLAMPLATASAPGAPTYNTVITRFDRAAQQVAASDLKQILAALQQDIAAWIAPQTGESADDLQRLMSVRDRLNAAVEAARQQAVVTADLLASQRIDFINEALHRSLRRLHNGAAAAGMTRTDYDRMVEMLTQRAMAASRLDPTADAVRARLSDHLRTLYNNAQRQALSGTDIDGFTDQLTANQITQGIRVWQDLNTKGKASIQEVVRIEFIIADITLGKLRALASQPQAVEVQATLNNAMLMAKRKVVAGQQVSPPEFTIIQSKLSELLQLASLSRAQGTPVDASGSTNDAGDPIDGGTRTPTGNR